MRARIVTTALACVLAVTLLVCGDASAAREPIKQPFNSKDQLEQWIPDSELSELVDGQIEGACGLAVAPSESFYVSDYYHRAIYRFSMLGLHQSTLELKGGDPSTIVNPIEKMNAVCGLAVDQADTLYAAEFHQRVLRMPAEEEIDPGPSTGIAVGADGDLFVDDRTYVAVYDAPVVPGEAPAQKIGLGSLGEAFGVAVDFETGRVYVADAADETVKAFDPETSLTTPVETIEGPEGTGEPHFHSLFNAALTVDNSDTEGKGHLLVVDDLKPRLDSPQAAIYEFDAAGASLGPPLEARLVGPQGDKKQGPIFGEPSGLAVDPKTGELYVTTGNSADANVVKYGPYFPPAAPEGAESGGSGVRAESSAGLRADESGAATAAPGEASASVTEQRRGVRVSFDGKLTPHVLPRHGTAPVGIVVDASIGATGGVDPPQLRRIAIAINRNGHFTPQGLPSCRIDQIQPATTENALAACHRSLVGEGHFSANVKLPQQSPFPSSGKVLAFNGKFDGRPAILAHIYGTDPAPTSTVLPFVLRKSHGTYGTALEASLPQATGNWGYVTGLRMSLRRRFSYRGHTRSFLSAGCPAPPGFPSAAFPLAKTSFAFAGNLTIKAVLTRTCKARG
jgi:DNA-binding beta-propeller fold protein YncE